MKIKIYTRKELWKMTPRKLRLELKKMDDYGREELIQEQRRLNKEAKSNQKLLKEGKTISNVEKIRQAMANSDITETTERDVLAHACGYCNAIMRIIEEKENRK